MENSSKNELIESMFKSLNSYTSELQQELEMIHRKLIDQVRLEQTYETSQDQLQNDLIQLRATIETNNVKRSILDRNLSERTNLSQSFHNEIIEKRQEQTTIIENSTRTKANYHRSIAKITEQCANLTMAFRTNYHAYARADFDDIEKKTQIRLKNIADEVHRIESLVESDREKYVELNEKLRDEAKEFQKLKHLIELIAKKLQNESDELSQSNRVNDQLIDLQHSIEELEMWHRRTNYPAETH